MILVLWFYMQLFRCVGDFHHRFVTFHFVIRRFRFRSSRLRHCQKSSHTLHTDSHWSHLRVVARLFVDTKVIGRQVAHACRHLTVPRRPEQSTRPPSGCYRSARTCHRLTRPQGRVFDPLEASSRCFSLRAAFAMLDRVTASTPEALPRNRGCSQHDRRVPESVARLISV